MVGALEDIQLNSGSESASETPAIPGRVQDIRLVSGPELTRWVDEVLAEIRAMVEEEGDEPSDEEDWEEGEGDEQWLGVSE